MISRRRPRPPRGRSLVWRPALPERAFLLDQKQDAVERMQDTSKGESPVWNQDNLPPFAALTNDEDRERKAELQQPGTFHVVVNPSSFANLPEYASESGSVEPTDTTSEWSLVNRPQSGTHAPQAVSFSTLEDDPNVVILNTFEDSAARSTPQAISVQQGAPATLYAPMPSSASVSHHIQALTLSSEPIANFAAFESPTQFEYLQDQSDSASLVHYRTFVKPRLIQFFRSGTSGLGIEDLADPFEEQARVFIPAYHALMALCDLSLTRRHGVPVDHYENILSFLEPPLGALDDILSDGSLVTHVLNLFYEIASMRWTPNLWSQRAAQLLRVIFERRNSQVRETYPYLIWWVCIIDIFVVLGGTGSGEFMQAIMRLNLLPPALSTLPPRSSLISGPLFPEEQNIFLPILQLNRELVILAAELGQMAKVLRADAVQRFATQNRIPPNWLSVDCGLPPRVEGVLKQAYALYRLCLIYSHTSMWPSQRAHLANADEREISECVAEVLRVGQTIVAEGRFTYRFIIFPLFLAGVAAHHSRDKKVALELIIAMERESVGNNTRATRQLLQFVYQRQSEGVMTVGTSVHVDWIQVMFESGVQLVHVGL
ncbi:hypothetical protein L228DRAFT_235892 [Xylona heveae TC161]|uniref:Transcription factor domain-containing protein n=1 Tax=Xylona heveae (strain CBS 132557 / TC161) TaxID=1328760 RepID=A0A165K1L2_XYLHT|nr:hypothetical protein L228DRAFT_235892 [Xylona heveae TC161]KZF26886.1 hypothetical protein L228DRAFT_235892 [Xylona heveae TC161]